MTAHTAKRLNEAEEAFGAPPPNETLNKLGLLMLSLVNSATPDPGLGVLMEMAENAEADAYRATLDPGMKILAAGVEFELLRDFFHKAATFGQTRHVSSLVSELHLTAILNSKKG